MNGIDDLRALKLAVLCGGTSSEREVSLASGRAVANALRGGRFELIELDPATPLWWDKLEAIDLAFNMLHGPGGEDGAMQGLLASLGVAGTGSGILGSALAMDKRRSKELWRAIGLPTPDFRIVDARDQLDPLLDSWGGLFLKPVFEGSSIGVRRVATVDDIGPAWEEAAGCGGPLMAEALVSGPEYTVAVLGQRSLPSIRISAAETFYDYAAKYELDTTTYQVPSGLSADQERSLGALALEAFRALGCSVWGRVDVMASESGDFQLLEVNTIPGMTDHSLVPKAAEAAGMSMLELLEEVIRLSLALAQAQAQGGQS